MDKFCGAFNYRKVLVIHVLLHVQTSGNTSTDNPPTLDSETDPSLGRGQNISVLRTFLSISGSSFLQNSAAEGGALYARGISVINVILSNFTENEAVRVGGALRVQVRKHFMCFIWSTSFTIYS